MGSGGPSDDQESEAGRSRRRAPHRVAFAVVALLLLSVVVLLPFSFGSVLSQIVTPQSDHVYPISEAVQPAATNTRLNLNVLAVDEWNHTATVRVSGQHDCAAGCPFQDEVILVALPANFQPSQGMPPSQTIMLPNKPDVVTQDITVQVSGDPVRYPFDTFHLTMAAILQRVFPDGTVQSLDGSAASQSLFLSLQMQAPRLVVSKPRLIDPNTVASAGPLYNWVTIYAVTFSRPLYLQVLAVLLVLLVTAAAVYAVFMRPLGQLLQNVGALVLGVWGIRAIILGTSLTGVTAVDLSLTAVVLFLLAAITFRTMLYLQQRAGLAPRRKRPGPG